MIKKPIPVLFFLLFSACSYEQSKINLQSKDYEQKEKSNNPVARATAKLCKGSVFFIPYGDTSVNFEGISEDTIKGRKIQIKGLKDIDLSANVDIRIEYSKYIIGEKKCLIIEGKMISPKLNKVIDDKNKPTDFQDGNDQKLNSKKNEQLKAPHNKIN